MLGPRDLLQLSYTPDLTAAGLAYACQLRADPAGRHFLPTRQVFQQLVLDKAVELAFRRYLAAQQVPTQTVPGNSFGDHVSYHLLLNGWRCNFNAYWLDQPEIVHQVESQPDCLLQAAAVISSARVIAWVPGEKDLYIFAFVTGQVTPGSTAVIPSPSWQNIPRSWMNLNLPGSTIYLVGYCTHPDYSRRSQRLEAGARVFLAAPVREKARFLFVSELRPLRELFKPTEQESK